MSKNIIGIHGFSANSERSMHNSGVALINNGKIAYACDEERFSRKKNEGRYPTSALKALFEESNLSIEDIDCVALPDKNSFWQLFKIIKYSLQTYLETGVFLNNYLLESFKRTLDNKRTLPVNLNGIRTYSVEHHVAHAASACFTSPFNKSTVITVDGMGDFSMSGIYGIQEKNKIKIDARLNGFYSPGIFYMIITEILGYVSGRHEGKVTGLAAFGTENEALARIFGYLIQYNPKRMDFVSKNIAFEVNDYISKYWVNGYNPSIDTNNFQEQEYKRNRRIQLSSFRQPLAGFRNEDIAYHAQRRLEEIILEHIEKVIRKTGIKNLCLAGGVFANVKLNQKIHELSCVENLWVYPAMSDSGLSVGAALYTYFDILGNAYIPQKPTSVFHGSSFSFEYIESLLKANRITYRVSTNIAVEIAKLLFEGKIVAHFNGRAEYGPRALGNRSILARATEASINATLNQKLNRTEFMPFAPLILEDFADELLLNWNMSDQNSRFMTITYGVTAKMKLIAPAAVHIDDTVRPQVVSNTDNPRLYEILQEYNKLSGIPVLINTSFNLHEEPIVNCPEDALKILQANCIDALVINNFIIYSDDLAKD